MDSLDFTSLVLYYGRGRFYNSMQKVALDGLSKYPTQMAFRLFNGFALALGNRVQEGIRELNPLKNDPELGLSAILALIYAHKRCSLVDRDALLILEQRLQEEESGTNANAAYYASVFFYFTSRIDQAREYTEKSLKLDAHHLQATVLKTWTELVSKTLAPGSGNVLHTLTAVLAQGKNIDATLAEVRYFQLRGQFDEAISVLTKLSMRFPELNIPLIAKMETQLAAVDWEHAFETAERIINLESTNIAALQIKCVVLLCRDGNAKASISILQQLLVAVERVETGNYGLMLETCQLFARNCWRNREVLKLTSRYAEKIMQLQPGKVDSITELGFQWFMLNNLKEAASCFRSATKLDDNYFHALCGLTLCNFLENSSSAEDIQQQIEVLTELRSAATRREPILLFLRALSAKDSDQAVVLLIEAAEAHLQYLEPYTFGCQYLHCLNSDFLLQIITELLRHSPLQAHVDYGKNATHDTLHITLRQCIRILDIVLCACPGHIQAMYMRAKVEFLCGEIATAGLTLQRILNDIDPTYTCAHLLLAQIQLQQQQFTKATQTLEVALSHNFSVRENPMYYLLLGIIQKQQKQLPEAQKSFMTAMQLVGSAYIGVDQYFEKSETSSRAISSNFAVFSEFSMADKATLYLNIIGTFREIGNAQAAYESERLLQYAMEEFSNTPEEGRIVIANADLMLQNCNVGKAVRLLEAVQPGQSYYIQAKTNLARIYLQYRKDRVAFAKCFKELADACPETESYLMLGEAYMSIQEPDLAVDAYQKALEMKPNDALLASKLGRTYVKAHKYRKAIKYYEEALKSCDKSGLKLDLAELYLMLKQYQNAVATLTTNMEQHKIDEQDIIALQFHTKELLLLARVHEKSGDISLSLQTLRVAHDNQYRVQKRVSVDQSGNQYDQQKVLSKICLLMAKQFVSLRDNKEAVKCLKECVNYAPQDIEILLSVARLYIQINSMEDVCRDVCLKILQIDSNNDTASVMMADLSFRKMDFENSAYHFSQLLITKPDYWTALARLIEVMRRSGTLQEVASFLQRAERITSNPTQSSGLNYCQGLYEWYSGNPNVALRHFNAARRNYEWGQQAIYNMIEICVNPDGDIPNSNDVLDAADSGEIGESRLIALRTAERLLKELRPRPGGMNDKVLNYRLLHNFLKMASKQKFQIESALQDFTELASHADYQNLAGPVFGMASALVQLKQTQRAKTHLKRIARVLWNFEEAEYLERSWLLLADIYIHANKLDVAESFVDRVLEHNKSSTKAYELAGSIAEKSQMFRNAAKHFHNAWNFGGHSKPHIGYKLAYNYMKIKQYSDAIDVCQQVTKLHPDYVVIRKDIFDKCRNSLRP